MNLVFKGVTYESLNDPEFISAMEKAVPFAVDPLHEEYDAARSSCDLLNRSDG